MEELKLRVLVVDDNERTLASIQLEIEDLADVVAVKDAEDALNLLVREKFDIVLTDYNLGHDEINGLTIFRRALYKDPYVTACLMTGTQFAPQMKEVFDTFNAFLIEKPFKDGALLELIRRGQNNRLRKAEHFGSDDAADEVFKNIVAETPSVIKLVDQVKRCALNPTLAVHMAGPSGTGKTTYAEIIHKLSGLKGKFVKVECGGLADLAMTRLFGYMKYSFTGANEDHVGYVKEADGGTLFLDEFHLLPDDVQGKLLHVLESGVFRPLGGKKDETSRFRVITAASVSVKQLAEKRKFSPDLWYRVSTKILTVPALSERKACLPKIIYKKIAQEAKKSNRVFEIEPAALDLFVTFSWDGNIRDLNNSIESICADLHPGQKITAASVREDLKERLGTFGTSQMEFNEGETFRDACKRFEIAVISDAVRKYKGNLSQAAKGLGIPRTSLNTRLEKLGIVPTQGETRKKKKIGRGSISESRTYL